MFLRTKSALAVNDGPVKNNARPGASAAPSIISEDLRILGDLKSEGDIQIDGRVEGDIESEKLTIGETAEVYGGILAETIRICGTVHGEVRGQKVVLTRTARVCGDILHETLEIEAGAFLEGHCRRLGREEAPANRVGSRPGSPAQEREPAAKVATTKVRGGVVSTLPRAIPDESR